MNKILKSFALIAIGVVIGRVKKSNRTYVNHLEQKKKDNRQEPKTVNFERWSSFNRHVNKN